MAGSFGDFLENKVLDHIFGNTAYTAPATIYVGLSTTTPTDAGANVTEPSGNAYARVAVTNNTTNWPNASAGSKSNGAAITFPMATPAGWGTVTHVVLYDASSGGNFLGWADLAVAKTVAALDTPAFSTGDIVITET